MTCLLDGLENNWSVLLTIHNESFLPSVCRVSHSERRSSRHKNNLSPVVLRPTQEYEIMSNDRAPTPPCSNMGVLSQADAPSVALCRNSSPLPPPNVIAPVPVEDTQTLTSVSAVRINQVDEEREGNVEVENDSAENHQLTGDSDSGIRAVEDQEEAAQGRGRYEYMDIRRSDSTEGEEPAQMSHGSLTSVKSAAGTEETDKIMEVLIKEQKEEEEEEKYHNTNKQPPLQGDLSSAAMPMPDMLKACGEKVEEYEEMTKCGVMPSAWEQADYQNLPVNRRAVPEEVDTGICTGIGGYIKVCAGMGEPGSNTSFDNPDYWHSRLFLKPDAVRT